MPTSEKQKSPDATLLKKKHLLVTKPTYGSINQ